MKSVSDVKQAKIVRRFLALLSNHTHTAADVGALSCTLLWTLSAENVTTNSSGEQLFAAQTIDIDLSGYDGVKIIRNYAEPVEVYRKPDGKFPTGTYGSVMSYVGSNEFSFVARKCTVSDNGVAFEDATQCNCTGSSHNTVQRHNRAAIPVAIYGIKGLR